MSISFLLLLACLYVIKLAVSLYVATHRIMPHPLVPEVFPFSAESFQTGLFNGSVEWATFSEC